MGTSIEVHDAGAGDGGPDLSGADPIHNDSMDFKRDGTVVGEEPIADATEAEGGDTKPEDPDAPTAEEGAEEAPEAAEEGDLPDFNPEDPEVVAKYDQTYTTEAGGPNITAFAEAWESRVDPETGLGKLTDGEYAYAQAAYGADKETVDDIIEGRIAKRTLMQAKFFDAVGGQEAYETAVEWGAAHYTAEQKERFNAAIDKGGAEAEEAALALQARFAKANGKPIPTLRRPLRGVTPKRDVANAAVSGQVSGGATAAKPFATGAEFRTAQAEAGRDPAKLAEVRKRLAVTPGNIA